MKYFIYQPGMTFAELTKEQFHKLSYDQQQAFGQSSVLLDKTAEAMVLFPFEHMRLMLPKEEKIVFPTLADQINKF